MHIFYIGMKSKQIMKTKSDQDKFVNLPSLCPAFNIRAASRIITQIFDDTLKPSGLQITQFAVLVGVHIMNTPSISTLAKGLVMDRTTLTRGLKPLENEEFIKIITGEDKRTRFVKLTIKGKSAIDKTLPYWEKAREIVAKEFGEQNLGSLIKDLESVREIKN